MNKIDKALIYVKHNIDFRLTKDDIEIGGQVHINSGRYEAVMSKNGKFFPFAFTPKVENFYKTIPFYQRKKKLKKLNERR